MHVDINHKQEAVKIFGASSAPLATVLLETLMEACSTTTMPGLLPYLQDKVFSKHKERTIQLLTNLGYSEEEPYDVFLDSWKEFIEATYLSGAKEERIAYEPVNLGAAFHESKLYYPVQTLVKKSRYERDGELRTTERIDVVVVRSDRTMQYIEESVDENGNASGIIRLTDGTLLQKRPSASPHASWSWNAIQEYLDGTYEPEPLEMLVRGIHQHLRSKIWLRSPSDYWLLTFAAVTSYVQAVFEAVPLILLNGEGGSGKSELGASMTEVSCNAVMVGQSSAPTIMRLIDAARGLVVIDDLESIGVTKKSGQEKFSEMVQVLKTSYKKSSATKIITNAKKMTEVMNFYGVKIVSNTAGVDDILGSRMLHVSTTKMPKSELESFLARPKVGVSELKKIRNDLHAWAFENSDQVSRVYEQIVAGSSQRDEEIAAPLQVIAKLAGIPEAEKGLMESLRAQNVRKQVHSSPEDALSNIMDMMIRDGAKRISLIEVSLAMRQALGAPTGKKSDYPIWAKPEWISKKLKALGYTEGSGSRKNVQGYQLRIFPVSEEKRQDLQAFGLQERDPIAFCSGCGQCPYRSLRCDIMPYRLTRESL